MKLGLDQVEYNNSYLKINIIKYLLIIIISFIVISIPTDLEILKVIKGIFLVLIVYSLVKFCMLCSVSKNSTMEFKEDSLEYTVDYNGKTLNPFLYYKIYRYYNVTSISESKYYFYITGEMDITNIYQIIKKSPTVKHKTGTFKIPKYFGEINSFKAELTKLIAAKRTTSDARNYQ